MDQTLYQWLQQSLVHAKTTPQRQDPRPPWAIEESQFLALCSHCGECANACPQGVIRISSRETYLGTPLEGTPVLDLSCGRCNFCGTCARSCPTGALDLTLGRQIQARVKVEESCQARLGFYCLLCEDACPQFAITLTSDGVQINREACDGCGACAIACLHGAIALVPVP